MRKGSLPLAIGLILIGVLSLVWEPQLSWAGFDDQHDVSAIVKAMQSPISPESIAQAQHFDDSLMTTGENNGTKVYLITDDRLKRTTSLARKLLAAMNQNDQEWVVRVLDTGEPVVNAFVTGGKYIYVFTGLLTQATTEDELAFILSHEIGHSLLKQNLRRQDDATTALANLADLIAAVAAKKQAQNVKAVTQAVRAGYSQGDEEEADAIAVVITQHAGLDPLRGLDFFSRLAREKNRVQEQAKRELAEMRSRMQPTIAECEQRATIFKKIRANGRTVNPEWAKETAAICDQAERSRVTYNAAVERYNQQINQGATEAIYSSHPGYQTRIAAVAALTDYVAGRRSLESLQQFQQSYRVMSALKQTNSILMNPTAKVEASQETSKLHPNSGISKFTAKSEKTMSDQLQQLKQAFDNGLLTEEEYQAKRKQVLDSF